MRVLASSDGAYQWLQRLAGSTGRTNAADLSAGWTRAAVDVVELTGLRDWRALTGDNDVDRRRGLTRGGCGDDLEVVGAGRDALAEGELAADRVDGELRGAL